MIDITDQEIIRRGNRPLHFYNKALDRLQECGFVTEVWIDHKHDIVTLRWCKDGTAWHVTARGLRLLFDQLEQTGRHANFWHVARERGLGTESNYAVREK